MYPCIRPSASPAGDMLTEEGRERTVEAGLYGLGIVLYLPAAVARTVVCHMDEVAHRFLCNISLYKIKKPSDMEGLYED